MTKAEKPYKPYRYSKPRSYRKLFLLAVEGKKTEKQYFSLPVLKSPTVRVECLPSGSDSSPMDVLQRMKSRLREEGFKTKKDEAWLVVDRDSWKDDHLDTLHQWTTEKPSYHLAVSNPKFEYWLLLHFEDGHGVATAKECDARLKKYLPNYNKSIDSTKITREQIDKAIDRAILRNIPPCKNWPRDPGKTTVYILVKNILKALYEQKT